jgi:hypothetical protein
MFGPPGCPSGPRAVGVRTDALPEQSSKPAERWGYLYLVGTYRSGTFYVASQSLHGPSTQPAGSSSFDRPPCGVPPSGWLLATRTEAQQRSLDHYSKLAGHHDLTSIAFFDHGSVLTVASTHPSRTRAVLGPFWHRQLCVVRASYSRAFMERVRARMVQLMMSPSHAAEYGWISGAGGSSVNDRGQPTTDIEVLLETPQLRALLGQLPRGLVVVQPALRPLGND